MRVTIIIDGDEYGSIELTKSISRGLERRPLSGAPQQKVAELRKVLTSLSTQARSWTIKNVK